MMVIVATRIPIRNDNRNVNLRDKVVLIVILWKLCYKYNIVFNPQ